MSVKFAEPTQLQLSKMHEFGATMQKIFNLISEHKESRHASIAFEKAESCMGFYNLCIMNLQVPESSDQAPVNDEKIDAPSDVH